VAKDGSRVIGHPRHVRQYETFVDERLLGFCAFCGGRPGTRDHVPPKVFLDKPYPANLPVVASCARCNSGASVDEEFVAALLEVVICGTPTPLTFTGRALHVRWSTAPRWPPC
jgi:hypothetical protein